MENDLHVRNMAPSEPIELPVHVILLAWKRVYLLPKQLVWLQNQEHLGRRHIHLHIINNNPMLVAEIDRIVEQFRADQALAVQFDVIVLVLMGLLVVDNGVIKPAICRGC